MSIFLTTQVSYATKVEAFNIRGLSNQVSVRACDAGVYPISRSSMETRIRYQHMHDELPSRIAGVKRQYHAVPEYTNILPKFDQFHFEAPGLIVEMKSGGEVLNAFGMFETGTSKMGLYTGKPNSEQIRQIMTLGLDFYSQVPAGNVNLAGYCAYIQAWRGINAFFYLGGGDLAEQERLSGGIARGVVNEMHTYLEANPTATGTFINVVALAFGTGLKRFFQAGQVRMIDQPGNRKGFPGFVFPYFREMITADADTPFQHFLKIYHHCIAANAEEASQSLELLRRGFRFLASTAAGKVVQHIYFGIQLCIELGGIMHLIKDGSEYAGFAIEGDNLSLLSKNRIRTSYSADDVETALELLSSHQSAVKLIYEAVVAIGRIDGADEEFVTQEECTQNPRKLRKLIQDRPAVSINELREVLNENIGKLRYSQAYWEITSSNILRFFQLMSQRSEIMQEPMYVHIDVFTNRSSSILEYLSVFGAQAPSIYFGNTVKQVKAVDEEDPNLRILQGKKVLPHIAFVKKGLIAAGADWATVQRQKAFKFAGPRQGAGPNPAFSDAKARDGIISTPDLDTFYPLLRLWCFSAQANNSGKKDTKGKKRAIDEDTGMAEAGSSKKSKVTYSFT